MNPHDNKAVLTARELAKQLGVSIEGPADRAVTGAAALQEAGPNDLSFAGGPAFFGAAQTSQAGCILTTQDYPNTEQCLMRVGQPRALFAKALVLLYPGETFVAGIHPTASLNGEFPGVQIGPQVTIAGDCLIGEGTRIGAGCSIGAKVTMGRECVLHAGVVIYPGVKIGDRVILHAGAVIGADGFGFAFHEGRYVKFPQVGTVDLGSDVEIGAQSCVDRAALGVTSIGEGTKIDNLVHIAHNCCIGKHVVIAAQTGLSGSVTVGDYAVIGGQVGVGDKARIEARAVVGSGSGILTSKIVRAGEPVWGTPARPLSRYLRQLAVLARMGRR
jgi:UDP-3-O-[3-hydroxymyristoyl] glucosamine N-acyltransferase